MIHFRNQLLARKKRKRNISNISVNLLLRQFFNKEGSIIKTALTVIIYFMKKEVIIKLGQNSFILRAKKKSYLNFLHQQHCFLKTAFVHF